MPAIGIDLGTTYSCVAVVKNGKVEVIQNDMGNRITPSYVAFTERERLIGDAAKMLATSNIKNTIFQTKRLMGRTHDEGCVQDDIKTFPYDVKKDGDGKPIIKVTHENAPKEFCAEQIGAMVLGYMKETAEAYLKPEKVSDAVITVPAYFNDAQRTATMDAGKIAGLNVLRLLNEPTAAAIAYGLDKSIHDMKYIFIFDLGGGTFDVTIARVKNRVIDVIATDGDTHLGGGDFDMRMVEHFASEFLKKHNISIYSNQTAMGRLREECEKAKRILSTATQYKLVIPSFCNGIDLNSTISRAKFDDLNSDLFDQTIDISEKTLKEAKIQPSEIDEVVLVGGSTRIPRIQELLKELFDETKIHKTINPDEAVAYGAAAFAANLTKSEDVQMEEFKISDVTPLSIGLESRGRDMDIIIKRNTKIPATEHRSRTTCDDNQTYVRFKVFEGERPATKDNHLLGSFLLQGIPPQPKGVPSFDTKFHIDENGVLTVSAYHKETDQQKEITISNDRGRLTTSRIDRMRTEAEMFKKADDKYKAQSKARNDLEDFVYTTKRSANSRKAKSGMYEGNRQKILQECSDIDNWLKYHNTADVNELRTKKQILENLCRQYSLPS